MESYDELKNLSLDELKDEYDLLSTSTIAGLAFYREEISRREAEITNSEMASMTKNIHHMTIAISLMTLVNVVAVVVQFWK